MDPAAFTVENAPASRDYQIILNGMRITGGSMSVRLAGTAGHGHERHALLGGDALEGRHEGRIGRRGLVIEHDFPVDLQAAPGGDFAHQALVHCIEPVPRLRVGMAGIDGEADLGGNDARKIRLDDDAPDRRNGRPADAMGRIDQPRGDFGESGKRIVPNVHREG